MKIHEERMQLAIKEAEKAMSCGEIPVGAVIICQGEVVGAGHNMCEAENDPTAHAEIVAIRDACRRKGYWRLSDCDLYVTLEPCPMCMGAILRSGIRTVYYGAFDEMGGGAGSVCDLSDMPGYIYRVDTKSGILAEKCSELLQSFFKNKRKDKEHT